HASGPARTARRCRQLASARRQPGAAVTKARSSRRAEAPMARLKEQPQRFSFDPAVRVLTFLRRRADPAGSARFTSTVGSSYLPAEVTQVRTEDGISE